MAQEPILTARGLVKRYGRQQELKYAAAVDALKIMGYGAVTFGGDDLRLSVTELIGAVTSLDEKPSPFVATNAALGSFDGFAFETASVALRRACVVRGFRWLVAFVMLVLRHLCPGVQAVRGDVVRDRVGN